MTTLRHPNILPPLEIEVAPDAVEDHLAAGWLPIEPSLQHHNPDPKPPAKVTNSRSKA